MSDKIDQRIVEMSFENQKFEKGISQSKNSLKEFSDALKKSSGMDKEFSGLEKSVTSLSGSFSMLEQIGIGALRRIGESAVDAGTKLLKSLTVDQLTAGWSKYEQKTASVQTIMNATGKSIDEVNGYLNQLMWFSDETSYGFTDMTAALAQMTSSGGDVKALIPLITGVANATAFAGKGAAEFSRAMYNLNQSYGAGNLQYIDWRSLELAGVAGKQLKQIFIETGIELGTLNEKGQTVKGTVVDIGNFSTTLQEKWANTKVMEAAFGKFSELSEAAYKLVEDGTYDTAAEAMDALAGKYSDIAEVSFRAAQTAKTFGESISATMDAVSSGWMRTYEIIFGDLEEAKRNFTSLTEILWTVFASGAENRNEMLAWLKEAGGISNVFQGFKNVAVALLSVLKPIAQAFDSIFPPKTREQWLAITESFKTFTATLIITDETADKIRRTFAGLFAVIDIGWQVFKFLGSAALEVIKIFFPLTSGVLGASASLGDLLVNIDKAIKSSQVFQYALLAVKIGVALLRAEISTLISGISEFVTGLLKAENPLEYLKNAGSRAFSGIIEGIKMAVSWLSGKFTKAVQAVSGLFNGVFDESAVGIWPTILKVLKEVVEFIGGEAVEGFQNFGNVIKNLDFHKIATFVVGGVLLIFVKQLSDLTGAMTGFTTAVTGVVNGFTKKFLGTKTTSMVRDMAFALGVLAASIWVLSTIPADDLSKSLIGLAKAVAIFVVAYGLLQGINVAATKLTADKKLVSSAFGLTGVAAALLIMATAVKTISKVDESQVWNATMVLGVMLGFITGYQVLAALISKIPGQQKVSANLFGMSASILALVGALALLNLFSLNDLQNSIGKMTAILLVIGALQGVFGLAARIGGGNKVSVNILSMAVGIAAMVAVMKLLSIIDPRTITQGIGNLALIALVLAGIEVMMGLAGRISGGKKLKTNILATQLGMLSMVALIAILGTMKQEDIDRGIVNLAKMAGIISGIELITAVSARISGGAKVQKILGSVTIALLAFTGVIALLGTFDQSVIDQGILTLTKMVGLIAAIELITAVASKISGEAKMFSSLMGVVVAIVALTGSLALLSMVDQESLRGAVTSLAIASVAIVALSFAMEKIADAVSLMSKGSKGFLDKVKNIGLTLVALSALLIATAAFFGVLSMVLPVIEKTSWDSLGKFTVGLSAITALLVVLDRIPMSDTGFVERIKGLIPGFVGVAAVLIAAMGFFGALKLILPIVDTVSWDSLGKFTVGLSIIAVLVGAMAALSPVFAAAGALGAGVLLGVVVAIAGVAAIVLAVVGLAELLNWMIQDADALTRGLDLLTEVGAGISRFVGAMAGGLAGGVLEGIGISLAAFVQSLSGFSPDSLEGIKALAEAILIITGAAIVDGIASFITGKSSMEVFGEQLTTLVAAINAISPDDASGASATLAAMKPMAENLKLFAEAATGIPNSGGFVGSFMGENDIDTFGTMLASFVRAFANVSVEQATHMTDVLAAMKPMAENLKLFASAAQKIPNSGGFLGEFMGENDINTFGVMLVQFVNAFSGVTTEQATHSTEVLAAMKPMAANLKLFAEAAQEIPNAGGFLGAFLGTVDLPTFSEQIHGLIDTFGTVDQAQLATATSSLQLMSETMLPALTEFSEFTNGLKASGGLAQLFSGNTTLSEFGSEFKKFVEQLSDVDFSVVGPAMEAMSNVTTSFETMGANVIENAKASFENNKEPFQESIATILDEPIEKLDTQKTTLVDTVSSVFKAVTDKGQSYVEEFKTLGGNLIDGLKSGIESKQASAITAVKNVLSSIVSAAKSVVDAHSPSKVFETIGGWCTKGLANGLSKETNVAVQAGVNMAKATEGGIRDTLGVHSISDLFSGIGSYIPASIGKGIQNGKGALLDAAKGLGIDTGNLTLQGVATSVAGGESGLTSGINSLLDLLTGTTSDAAADTGENIGDGVANGARSALSNSVTGIGGSKTQATVKSELDKLKAIIEEREFYGTITVEQELELYQKLRKSYKKGSEERKQIDREIYTRLKTIYDAQMSYIEDVQKAQKDAADERAKLEADYIQDVADAQDEANKKLSDLKKKYDQDVLQAKTDADKKTQNEDKSYYNDLNSILDKAEQDRQRLREDYASNQKSINAKLLSDIDAQNKAYESAVKSRADAIYNSYNLFDAVGADEEVTGEELLKNLQDQGAALSEWKQSLADLASRGVGDALIEELQAMGPSTKAQIKALLTLTDEQLTEYVGLFEGKYAFARTKAEEELEGLKNSTAQAIQDLNAQAAIDLDNLEAEFNSSMSNINSQMVSDLSDLRDTHNAALAEINADLRDKLTELQVTWGQASSEVNADLTDKLNDLGSTYNSSLDKINTDLQNNLDEMKTKFSTSMKEIAGLTEKQLRQMIADNKTKLAQLNTDTDAKLDDVEKTYDASGNKIVSSFDTILQKLIPNAASTLTNLISTIKNSFNSANTDFENAGYNASLGFAQGIRNGSYQAVNAAKYLARAAVNAAEAILNENSPSKVFEGIGKFVSMGFANGIINYADQAEKASEKMASGPIAAVSQALADMEDSDDLTFTITPVLDLSAVRSTDIAQLLNKPVQLGTTSTRLAEEAVQNGSRDTTPATTIINKFDLTGLTVRQESDVDAIATKLYQKQQIAARGRGQRAPARA